MLLKRPPSDMEQASALADEHYRYCMDIVDQGCGTVKALASTLVNQSIWYFWWD